MILEAACDFVKLAELTAEKEKTDAELEERIARFVELEEKLESFR